MIALVGALVYANDLSGPFVFDDQIAIVTNPALREWWNLGHMFAQRINTPLAGRPLVAMSFALNYAVSDLRVFSYHLINIGIHVLCALLLFGIVRRTLQTRRLTPHYGPAALDLAFAVALLWVVHPLNSEVVDYLTQRTESMMALFYLLTLYTNIRSHSAPRPIVWETLAIVTCALGMACKEPMVTAPLMVMVYDRVFIFDSLGAAWKKRWRVYSMLALGWLILWYLLLPGPRSSSVGFSTFVRPTTYLFNEARMITRYWHLSFWPDKLVLFYGPAIPLALRDVWFQGSMVLAVLLLALWALRFRPAMGFLGAWVFVILAPTSSVIPIATEVGAERRMYLPLMAILVFVVTGAYTLAGRTRKIPASVAWVTLAAVSIALTATTLARNLEYASGLTLANTVVSRWPTDVGHHMLGSELAHANRHDEAIAELRISARTYPNARYNLGIELFNTKRFEEAIHELQTFVNEEPSLAEVPSARMAMGDAFRFEHKWSEAVDQYRLVLSMTPGDGVARSMFVAVLVNQGIEFAQSNRLDEAIAIFARASALAPRNIGPHQNLAAAYIARDQPDSALAEARVAISIDPGNASSYDLLGRSLAAQGDLGEAASQFEQALRIDPHDQQTIDDLNMVRRAMKR